MQVKHENNLFYSPRQATGKSQGTDFLQSQDKGDEQHNAGENGPV